MGDARETEKDPDAFRTISEVAEDLNLPQHVLRFWETRFPQIKPVKRAGGRRFYRPEDVDLLRGIRQLLYREGYTIKGVQKILKEQGIRHVQDVGIERDVAVMRSAPAERAAPAQDGVILGGLLGLLPRRRNKGYDDPVLDTVPRDVELPLPFPDPEADRDLAMDRGEPVAPLPPRARRAAERRSDDDLSDPRYRVARAYDEPAYAEDAGEEQTYEEPEYDDRGYEEPRLTAPSRARRDFPEDADEFPPTRPASRRAAEPEPPPRFTEAPDVVAERPRTATGPAPSFAPQRGERPEPVVRRRPTRGPAARVSTAPVADFEDPLLPFMESEPPAAPAPLEERIRRLQARDAGPPEEYLPPKLRRRPAPPEPRAPAMDERAQAPAARMRAPSPTAWPELARAEAAAEQDLAAWHEHLSPPAPADEPEQADFWSEEGASCASDPGGRYAGGEAAAPDAGTDADEWYDPAEDEAPAAVAPQPEVWAEDDADAWGEEPFEEAAPADPYPPHHPHGQVRRPAGQGGGQPVAFHLRAPVSARLGMGAASALAGATRPSPSPAREAAAMSVPPAFVRKGPATAEHAAPRQRSMPAASAPPVPPRRVGPLAGPLMDPPEEDPLEEDLPQVPLQMPPQAYPAQGAGMGPWRRPAQSGTPFDVSPQSAVPHGSSPHGVSAPAGAFWQGREPFDGPAAAPPIDPYLPPHLRGEVQRPAGQGGVQPVLSRDDVHRLQAALYELGECRRLLREVTEPKPETTEA